MHDDGTYHHNSIGYVDIVQRYYLGVTPDSPDDERWSENIKSILFAI